MGAESKNDLPQAGGTSALGHFDLDATLDRDKMVQSIADAIGHQVPYASQEQIEEAVNETFDTLLGKATVTKHIGALVEGIVRRKVKNLAARNKFFMEPRPY